MSVTPSNVLHEFIKTHKNEYVKKQIMEAVTRESIPILESDETLEPINGDAIEVEKDMSKVCPTCSSKLYFTDGCSVCIDCGYSGCASG